MRIRVITSDGGDNPPRFLALSDSHLVMALRQDRTFIHIVNVDGDCCCGCRSVSATDQSYWVLSTEHENVLTLTFEVQDLRVRTHTQRENIP